MQKFSGDGYFFIEVCNYECRLVYFDDEIVEYIEDAERAGITTDEMEEYIIETGNLTLSGWHPISSWMLNKLLHFFINNRHTKKCNITQSHPRAI